MSTFLVAALVVAGCVSVGPGATVPPINVPSPPLSLPTMPPINVPSVSIPTLPPINVPSVSIPTLPPIDLPSLPPIGLPSAAPGSGLCRLISPEEVSSILGSQVSVTESSDTSCTFFSTSDFSTITMRTESTSLQDAKLILSNARDLTVGPYPAVIGSFMGILLYMQGPGQTLVVQAVLLEDNEANQQKVIQIGTTAASRW